MHIKSLASAIIGLAFAATSLATFASPQKSLSSYDQLLAALQAGDQVRAVVHFDKCKLTSGEPIIAISGGFSFSEFNHYNMPVDATHTKEVIATAKTVTAITSTGPVNNYIRLRVFQDNNAEFYGVLIDPKTNEMKLAVSYLCSLSGDQNQAGVTLYNLNG